ncbi:hypothetical protein [Mangrovimonas sp. DI 80]|uniref:hypothetical protein n=1 Tax=Mangrovimonas sp. DI 80 TaxID=1779330 RepID=UPI000978849F|nr:hypothetical protein [Mangrovimonas sp. DI 80]OMP30503.1 hypothetical protein BKM32_14125 [Mangrovimonas sp. DI 80]
MDVTIYKTNVNNEHVAQQVITQLQAIIPDFMINFDLEDCDNILRLSGNRMVSDLVIQCLTSNGFECSEIV